MVDRADAAFLKEIRENPLHHLPAGEHVRHAAGNAQIIFEYDESPIRHADEVAADDGDVDIARDVQSAHLPAKLFAAVDYFAGYNSVREDLALVVDVFQKQVQ